MSKSSKKPHKPAKTSADPADSQADQKEVDGRYKGYELLLDIEELENEPDLPPAKGE